MELDGLDGLLARRKVRDPSRLEGVFHGAEEAHVLRFSNGVLVADEGNEGGGGGRRPIARLLASLECCDPIAQ